MQKINDSVDDRLSQISKKLDLLLDLANRNLMDADIYTTASLAKKLNVCTRIIQKWRDCGDIEFVKKGRKVFYTGHHLKKFLQTYCNTAYKNNI
jgi:hypothetical protein